MKYVQTNGVNLACDDEGVGSPTFLFVHGLACDRSAWRPQFDDLKRDHRCVAVDLRGRGDSASAFPCDPETAAADVAGVIQALDLGPSIIVGHSLGGVVALLLNYRWPELVRGIVTGDTPLSAELGANFGRTAAAVRAEGSSKPIESLIQSFFVPGTSHVVRDDVRTLMLGCPPDVLAGMMDGCAHLPAISKELVSAADKKPFMAIWAERPMGDPAWLRDTTMFLRQEPIAGTGHFFQLDEPAITTALLRAFLDDVERDPRVA